MSNSNSSNSNNKNIEFLDLFNSHYSLFQSVKLLERTTGSRYVLAGGVKQLRYPQSGYESSCLQYGQYIFTESTKDIIRKEIENYPADGSGKSTSADRSSKVVIYGGPYSYYLGVSTQNVDESLARLLDPVNTPDSQDKVENNDKLFFMEGVQFPRRKLSLLTDANGKISNISTCRKLENATKIVGNKIITREYLKGLVSKSKILTHNNNYVLIINTTCINDSPGGSFSKGEKKSFYIELNAYNGSDFHFGEFFMVNNLNYITGEQLEKYHPKLNASLLSVINDSECVSGFSYYTAATPEKSLPNLAHKNYHDSKTIFEIDDVELFYGLGPINDKSDINKNYIDCINKNLNIIDVDCVYKVIGNEVMSFESFIDTNDTLIAAIKSNNSSVIKLMLESITSYDIDSSILYLCIIFRNMMAIGAGYSHFNTNVRSLYDFCTTKGKFNAGTSTLSIINSLNAQGYDVKIPLSFLLVEANTDSAVRSYKDKLNDDKKISSIFEADVTVQLRIKSDLLKSIILDVDIDDFNSKINQKKS